MEFPPPPPPPERLLPAMTYGTTVPLPPPPPLPKSKSKVAGWLSSLGIVGVLLVKFGAKLAFLLPALKFVAPFLKTGLSMLLSIGVYAMAYGWRYAVGFVLLIFVHEMGHVWAARQCGIKVSAPVFIPFIGAHILLKQNLPGAWVEAKIGVGGPLLGAVGALFCHLVWLATGNDLFGALAFTGYFLNLFNLVPVSPLDGGRITTAISPWLWVAGYAVLGTWLGWRIWSAFNGGATLGVGLFLMAFILVSGLPRLVWLFRGNKSAEERGCFTVTTGQRLTMTALYFGLIAALGAGMAATHVQVN